jgi:NAD(P)-dependent dehydrogenase (short-subunit alcohol dehydrogenase family)
VDRLAIVTGAESGIGKATAIAFADAGYDIGYTWLRSEQAAEATTEEIRARERRAVRRRLDLSRPEAGGPVIDQLIDELGGVDVLVNNAAMGYTSSFLETSLDEWRRVLDIDLTGQFVCAQAAARRMVDADRQGVIVNITSIQDSFPVSNTCAYGAAKGGLRQLTRVMAIELGRNNIRVNAVAPGEINTAMSGREGLAGSAVPRPALPAGRAGNPTEVAAAIVWLASDAARYVTGATLVVDGGAVLLGPELALRD